MSLGAVINVGVHRVPAWTYLDLFAEMYDKAG